MQAIDRMTRMNELTIFTLVSHLLYNFMHLQVDELRLLYDH